MTSTEFKKTGQILPAYRGQILPPVLLHETTLQGVNFTPRMAFPRGQILPAINNYQGIGGYSRDGYGHEFTGIPV